MTATQLSQLRVLGWSQLSTEITGYNKYKHKLGLSRADIDEIDNDPRDFYSAQRLKWKNKSIDFDNPSKLSATLVN